MPAVVADGTSGAFADVDELASPDESDDAAGAGMPGVADVPWLCASDCSGAAPELPSGPPWCGAAARNGGRLPGFSCWPSVTRPTIPSPVPQRAAALKPVDNSPGATRRTRFRRTRGLVFPHAALRIQVPRLRRHLRGQPSDAGGVRAGRLPAGSRRHGKAVIHGRGHGPRGCLGARTGTGDRRRRRRRRLLRRRVRLLTA
jgi:hypothetical protein